jgi:tRNA G18 (ribose-2'-O)-methylase SpoU
MSDLSTKPSLCFLVDDMHSPFNIGSLFRIADALGVEKIYLTGESITPPNDKIRKNSRATDKYVTYEYRPDAVPLVAELKMSGYRIISLELTNQSIPLHQLQLDQRNICLILGSENGGIKADLLDASDSIVVIPMQGQNESMNVATAAAIAVYNMKQQLQLLFD